MTLSTPGSVVTKCSCSDMPRYINPADLPAEMTAYAMRDLDALQRKATAHGDHVTN